MAIYAFNGIKKCLLLSSRLQYPKYIKIGKGLPIFSFFKTIAWDTEKSVMRIATFFVPSLLKYEYTINAHIFQM